MNQIEKATANMRTFQLWCPQNGMVSSLLVGVPSRLSIEEQLANQPRYKTELCRKFVLTGACPFGDACTFAHNPDELRPVLRHPKYKTVLCRAWYSTGYCPYGNRCRFIHELATPLAGVADVPKGPPLAVEGTPVVSGTAVVPVTDACLKDVYIHNKKVSRHARRSKREMARFGSDSSLPEMDQTLISQANSSFGMHDISTGSAELSLGGVPGPVSPPSSIGSSPAASYSPPPGLPSLAPRSAGSASPDGASQLSPPACDPAQLAKPEDPFSMALLQAALTLSGMVQAQAAAPPPPPPPPPVAPAPQPQGDAAMLTALLQQEQQQQWALLAASLSPQQQQQLLMLLAQQQQGAPMPLATPMLAPAPAVPLMPTHSAAPSQQRGLQQHPETRAAALAPGLFGAGPAALLHPSGAGTGSGLLRMPSHSPAHAPPAQHQRPLPTGLLHGGGLGTALLPTPGFVRQ